MSVTNDKAPPWQFERLGNLAQVKGGKRLPKGKKLLSKPTPFPYIRVCDFNAFSVDLSDIQYLTPAIREPIKRYIITKEDVFISIAGTIGRVGTIPESIDGANLTENAARVVIKSDGSLDREFLKFCLASPEIQNNIASRRSKNAQPKLALAQIKELEIPLPPLPEQKKIAHILSTVQQAIEAQERIIQTTTELKKALMHKLFTEGLRNEPQKQTEIGLIPESWAVCKVGDVAKLQSGGTPRRETAENWSGGNIPWVKTGEINYCVINDTEEKITLTGLSNSAARLFPKGSLLMAMYGQGITRGKVGLLGIEASTNQACVSITPIDQKRISSVFLYFFFEYHYENLRQLGHGANQRNMNAALIRSFPLTFPKTDEQNCIVAALKSFDEKRVLHERKRIQLQELFRTLLRNLMTANTRVHAVEIAV